MPQTTHRPNRAAVIETLESRRLLAVAVDQDWGNGGLGQVDLNVPGNVVVTELGEIAGGDMLIAGDVEGAEQDSFLIRRDYWGDPRIGFGENGIARYTYEPFHKVFEQLDGTLLAMPRGVQDDDGPDLVRINADTGVVIEEITVPGGLTGENVDLQPVNVPGYTGANLFITKHGAALFNDNGSLDTSFGTSGLMKFEKASSSNGYTTFVPKAGKIQSNGNVLFSGQLVSLLTSNDYGQIRRYTPQGAPDTTFANYGVWQHPQTGVDILDITVFSNEFFGNGAILAAGDDGTNTHIVRLRSNGAVEINFSNDGRELIAGRLGDMHLSPSGGVVASTFRTNPVDPFVGSTRLTRLTFYGTYDVTYFGTDGEVRVIDGDALPYSHLHFRLTPSGEHQFVTSAMDRAADTFVASIRSGTVSSRGVVGNIGEQAISTNHDQRFRAATIDSQGRPIIAGNAAWPGIGSAAGRFSSDGQADLTFGKNGAAVATQDGAGQMALGVATGSDDAIYMVGMSDGDIVKSCVRL